MDRKIERPLILDFVVFCMGVAFISLLYPNALLLTALLFLCWLVALKFWHTRRDFYYFIFGAIIGTGAEIVAVYFGAWQYANPTLLNIPIWLPFAWGLSVLVIRRTAETIIGPVSQ